jgi:hypothetical protein
MGIDLAEANRQASRASGFAGDLRAVQRDLQNYQSNLQQHWQAAEMGLINNAINVLLQKITSAANELASLGGDINTAAAMVKRAEDLAAAQVVLTNAQNRLNTAKRSLTLAQNMYNSNPNSLSETALKQAKNAYNTANSAYNIAAAKVRELSANAGGSGGGGGGSW